MNSRTRRLLALLAAGLVAILGLPAVVSASGEPPVAIDDYADYDLGLVTNLDDPPTLSIDVLGNDSDPEGDTLSVISVTTGMNGGTLSCETVDGKCMFKPLPISPDFIPGGDTFQVTISDGTSTTQSFVYVTTVGTLPVDPPTCIDPTNGLNDTGLVTGYDWLACTGETSNGLVNNFSPLLPSTGASSLLITSGTVEAAMPPNDETGETGAVEQANTYRGANDVQVLKLNLTVPAGMSCLAFDFVFGSEEYPEFVNTSFNDGFLAELDSHTWSVEGQTITAPDNFAFDSGGDLVSINSTFFAPERVITETGMQYDGSTPRLRAQTPITPGAHSLYLSIFDASDNILDSGALIDNLRVSAAAAADCGKGAVVEIAVDDNWTTTEENPALGNVTTNDLLAATATPTVLVATQPANGTAQCTTAGLCSYTPNLNFNGVDSFTYLIEDGLGANDNGTVTITVGPVNDAPTAQNDSITTEEGVPGSTNVLANDSDIDGDSLTVIGQAQGDNGSVACTGAGVCTYTPNAGFVGSDSFSYTISDGNGATDTAIVNVTVTESTTPPVNNPPVAVDDTGTSTDGAAANVSVLANDTDADGDTLTVTGSTQPANGTVNCTSSACTYTPNAGFEGTDTFTYTVSDGKGGTDTATVTITVTQTPPPAGCVKDEIAIVLSGGLSGGYTGCVDSGDLKVTRDDFGISSVKGSVMVPSLKGGSGQAKITVDVERLWILPIYLGKTKIKDSNAGINASAYSVISGVSGSGNQARVTGSGLAGKWWNFNFFNMVLDITDR